MPRQKTKDSLGDRIKDYELAFRTTLPKRLPIVVRVDGKAFHTLTRHCERPFDARLMSVMDATAVALCEEIQGAQMAYIQSDEISVLVHGYKTVQTQPWFRNELQKMVSIAASEATASFNNAARHTTLGKEGEARFDARAFVLPENDVCNYFIWRQQDASKNSIQMVARANFSHKVLNHKNTNELQEMLWQEKGINWSKMPTRQKRGRTALRHTVLRQEIQRNEWRIDEETPLFTQDREYVERHLRRED